MHWTISKWKDYATCPKRYEYRYVLKTAEPGPRAPALQRGDDWHKDIERYLLGRQKKLTIPVSKSWAEQIAHLRYLKAESEQMWEFEEGWYPYTHNAEYPLWLRMKLDANYALRPGVHAVIDFKTGKCYPADSEQIEVYALGTFGTYDKVNEVHGALWYLDQGEPLERTIKREQAPKLARKWESRASEVLNAKTFPARAGRHCGWCPFKTICPEATTRK